MMRELFVRAAIAAGLAAGFVGAASAHDVWLDFGEAYSARPGGALTASFLVGHATDAEPWALRPERVVSMKSYGPGPAEDLQQSLLFPGVSANAGAKFKLSANGSHIVAFESTPAEIELEAEKYNAYIAEEGLSLAIAHRKEAGETEAPGRELYSRRATAIVQVGASPTDNVTRALGLTLEIVPEKNPLSLGPEEALPVRIYYRGAPLVGAHVHLESLTVGLLPEKTEVTDADGRAVFSYPHRGAWKLDVVWSVPIDHPRADFDTIFSSLTFGY